MEKQINYVDDMINRYVYQVTRRLPNNTRKDIEQELRTLITDMLEEKTQGNTPGKQDIDTVLKELGSPYELADKYRDNSHYLISPTIYPAWLFVLKIVMGAVLLGIAISSVLGLISEEGIVWYEYLGSCLATLFSGEFMAFAWVTLIFAIIERRGLNVKELVPDWDIASLPPVSTHEVSIPIWGPIAEIVFTIFIMLIFLLSPQLIGAYSIDNGVTIIPVFDLDAIRAVMPLILLCLGVGILKNIWELVDGKYSIRYSFFTLGVDVIEIILTIIIFKGFKIWNSSFIGQVNQLFHLNADTSVYEVLGNVTNKFVLFLILLYLLDIGSTFIKSFKAEGKGLFDR
jgi:hypothetical protein